MKKIIAATDFSPAAENAVNYAADMADAIGAHLLLLHVCQLPVSFGDIPVAVYIDDLVKEAENDLAAVSDKVNHRLKGRVGMETRVLTGTYFEELETLCQEVKPYAVITGSQGKTRAERLLFGSHSVYAMQHLNWPMITVPAGATFHTIRNIGFACDFNEVIATTPVDEIKGLVHDFHAKLHILNTAKMETFEPEVVFQSGMLQEMLESLQPSYHFIASDDVEEGILHFADENQIDLLIVLPKRHGLIDKLTHRSHTKQLVLHSHVPVMALHENGSEA